MDEHRLKHVIATVLGVDPNTISDKSSMDSIERWDSLRHMNLVLALENEFGIMIPDEDAANITSYPLIKLVMNEQLQVI